MVAMALASAGLRVALMANGLVGGESPYLACMPSKSAVRGGRQAASTTVHATTSAPLGLADPAADWPAALSCRD